jgi:general secretion pathway protein C
VIAALAPWIRTGVLLAALVSLAAAAAPVAWHLRGWSAALPARPPSPGPAPADPEPVDLGPILNLAPFGAVAAEPEPEAPLGETSLDLVLHGVVVQEEPAASIAFIGHQGITQGYRPGDPVAERATLREVAATQVVLEVDGALQILSFPDRDGAADASAAAPALSGPDRLRQLVAAQGRGNGGEPPPPEPERGPPQTTQDHIDLWRERIRANPAEVLDRIGLIPTPEGYRIDEEHDSGVGLAGLQAGDVVRSVNGQAVGDVDRDRRLFDEVAASGLARIEVRRGDRTITMSFPLE